MNNQEDLGLYYRVFQQNADGVKVLEELVRLFYDRSTYVKGGVEAARESDYRNGGRDVVGFILKKVLPKETQQVNND